MPLDAAEAFPGHVDSGVHLFMHVRVLTESHPNADVQAPHTTNGQRFRGGLVFKARRLCASLNSRLESNQKNEKIKKTLRIAHEMKP